MIKNQGMFFYILCLVWEKVKAKRLFCQAIITLGSPRSGKVFFFPK